MIDASEFQGFDFRWVASVGDDVSDGEDLLCWVTKWWSCSRLDSRSGNGRCNGFRYRAIYYRVETTGERPPGSGTGFDEAAMMIGARGGARGRSGS